MSRIGFVPPVRHVERVFLHCSASDNPDHDDVTVIDRWHRQRGFDGVGYHYFITKAGKIQIGRPLSRIPAAQKGHNRGTIAICLHGLQKEKFTDAQRQALVDLCVEIDDVYRKERMRMLDGEPVTFHGHCEVAAKDCPVFPYKEWLKLTPEGELGVAPQSALDAPNMELLAVVAAREAEQRRAIKEAMRILGDAVAGKAKDR